ncbi:hypothetical protein B0H14DRAFT_2605911 [Mycena olivaceomarginata]|nr:hypothetical protein B0H14DRAFT_2605911 [Mycena olivaceomarginata]
MSEYQTVGASLLCSSLYRHQLTSLATMSKQKRNPSEPMMHAIYCYRWRQKYVRFHELCLHYNGTYAIEIWRTTDAKTEKEWLATEPLITLFLLKFFNPGWKNDVPLPPDIAKRMAVEGEGTYPLQKNCRGVSRS